MIRRVGCVLICLILLNFVWPGQWSAAQTSSSTASTPPRPNWTVGADGKSAWLYSQYSQLGQNGFFGPYNIDLSQAGTPVRATGPPIGAGDFAALNGWMGVQNFQNPLALSANVATGLIVSSTNGLPNILTSGTNATRTSLAQEYGTSAPFAWANVWGRYKIIPYDTGSAPGSEVAMSPGQWTHMGVNVTPPIGGSLFVGKNIFARGCGLQFSENRTLEQIIFETDPLLVPDVLGKWLPFLTCRPIPRPIGRVAKQICKKLTPTDNPDKDQSDGTKYIYFKDKDEFDIALGIETGEYQETDIGGPCADGSVQVRWKDSSTGQQTACFKRGITVYEETSQNFATVKFGFGFFPWIQDIIIVNFNPDSYSPLTTKLPWPWNNYDVNLAQRASILAYLMWQNDVLYFDVGTLYSASHAGPELAQSTADRVVFPPTDRWTNEGWVFLDFCNNRLRLRTELDWFTRETRYQPSFNGTFFGFNDPPIPLLPGPIAAQTPPGPPHVDGSGSPFVVQQIQSLRFMAQGDLYCGPWMFTLFYSHMPGPDRRHGILIQRQPYINTVEQTGLDAFYSMSSLLAFRYGGGVNSPGDLSDASTIAGRIEYALAANLHVRASYLNATRVSHGYGWGWIRPSPILPRFGQVDYDPELRSYLAQSPVPRNPFTENIPAIPARDLGWEIDAGMHWQLLDQFVVDLNFSYWRPGKWFNYACVDRSVPGWNNPTAANNWGINPDRTIDPVMGFELALLYSY
ncbi:MAG: hypothetical protein ACLQPD_02410 [Desulfomonilaceae bacterium]